MLGINRQKLCHRSGTDWFLDIITNYENQFTFLYIYIYKLYFKLFIKNIISVLIVGLPSMYQPIT